MDWISPESGLTAGLVTALVVGLWLMHRGMRETSARRQELIRAAADRFGMAYAEEDLADLERLLPHVDVWPWSGARRCCNIAYDARESPGDMVICDYVCSSTYLFVCTLRLDPPLDTPVSVFLCGEDSVSRVFEAVGFVEDVDFRNDPDFNRRFMIDSSGDADAAARLLSVPVRRRIMSLEAQWPPILAISPERLVVAVYRRETPDLEAIDRVVTYARELRQALVER